MYWILFTITLAITFYFCLIRHFSYWTRKGISQKSVIEQWVDALRMLLQLRAPAELDRTFFNLFPDKRYSGTFQFLSPVLVLRDPDLIKQITVKDFDHFVDHKQIIPEDVEPLFGKNLLSLKGERWRDMRATLSPSFTSSKMRSMFQLMDECAKQFVTFFRQSKTAQVVDMKDALSRYANDVIASTAFGISCNSLEDRNNEFFLMGAEATNLRGFWRGLKTLLIIIAPKLCKLLGIRMFSLNVTEFFIRLVKSNIESREKSGVVRPDMIHLLMEAKNGRLKHEEQSSDLDSGFAVIEESAIGKDVTRQKPPLTDEDLTAQVVIFFIAGFESVSVLMCFLIYELAVNPDIQEKLRQEVKDTLKDCNGAITYESLLKMKYMDMVVSEILRKWPIAVGMDRLCVKPYVIEPKKPGEVPFHLEKGESVWLPIYGIHRSPQFYPNPDRFDPERFNDDNKGSIYPYSYIPFGAGPRSCIGTRYALLEIKTICFHILNNFEINATKDTNIPCKLAKSIFGLYSENGFSFELKPLSGI